MKNQDWLLIGLGGAVLLYLYSRTDTGQQQIATVADDIGQGVGSIMSTIRGIRNNNPGNIRRSSTAWRGLSPTQTDPAFFQFTSMDYGIRAMAVILDTYATKYGLTTVRGIINRWAPPNENNTDSYVSFVAGQLGVLPDDELDMNDPSTVQALVSAIIKQENGIAGAQFVADSSIVNGVQMAMA